jgi:uncharacterized membrane protein YhaH (DUF805 family)
MARTHTRDERKKHLKERFRRRRDKFFMMALTAVVFILLVALLVYGVSIQADPFLLIILAVIILVLIPVSTFLMDTITFET